MRALALSSPLASRLASAQVVRGILLNKHHVHRGRSITRQCRYLSNDTVPKDSVSPPDVRFPRSVQALYLKPLRREAEYGIPSCDLQLRSFSLRNLEFFADFALRAAYYLKLPAFGPVPLPRITERWTVPKSSFIFKKSQENFERVTVRRLIQIRDGNPETVQLWLAFLQKHAYYGIGMKANIWEFGALDAMTAVQSGSSELNTIQSKWEHLALHQTAPTVAKVEELLTSRKFKAIGEEKREAEAAKSWPASPATTRS